MHACVLHVCVCVLQSSTLRCQWLQLLKSHLAITFTVQKNFTANFCGVFSAHGGEEADAKGNSEGMQHTGVSISPGANIFISVWNLHRNPRMWCVHTLSLTFSLPLALSLSHTHTHAHARTHVLSLFLSLAHNPVASRLINSHEHRDNPDHFDPSRFTRPQVLSPSLSPDFSVFLLRPPLYFSHPLALCLYIASALLFVTLTQLCPFRAQCGERCYTLQHTATHCNITQ